MILSWIGFAAMVLFINSSLNPNYADETATILISLICLINTGTLFTGIIGINKKVRDFEEMQWKKEFREQNKGEIAAFSRQINFQRALDTEKKEDPEIITFNEKMEKAQTSWKTKHKETYNHFEQYHYLIHKIGRFNMITNVLSMLLSLSTALIILNFTLLSPKIHFGYAALLLSMLVMIFYIGNLSRQEKKLKELIYPQSLKDAIKGLNIW
ncbi:hypothetical protein [Mesobacillus zeae]|uniref:hypothetical protein n=1 Tax=Mesobacillus zeae TaxID=1917180 RepID=UPI00300AC873